MNFQQRKVELRSILYFFDSQINKKMKHWPVVAWYMTWTAELWFLRRPMRIEVFYESFFYLKARYRFTWVVTDRPNQDLRNRIEERSLVS